MSSLADLARAAELVSAIPFCGLRIDPVVRRGAHFIIGKSGADEAATKARYVPEQYAYWEVIYRSRDAQFIGQLEVALIQKYREMAPNQCDNEQDGGGPGDDSTYVYLAHD